MYTCLYVQAIQFVHQVNSDAQVDNAFLQARDVMVILPALMLLMKLIAVSFEKLEKCKKTCLYYHTIFLNIYRQLINIFLMSSKHFSLCSCSVIYLIFPLLISMHRLYI